MLEGKRARSLLSLLRFTRRLHYINMTALQLSYTLNPPTGTPTPSLPFQATHSYALEDSSAQQHLISLEAALGKAREQLNEDLTVWKEAVKGLEAEKKKKKKAESEEEDGEDDEEE